MTKEKIEKCWMCNRTAEKALNDFRELILESTETCTCSIISGSIGS